MDLQQILSLTRKCIDKYNLIENGDKIAVSCSGGKDSLTLAVALNALKRFYPHQFDIKVVSVDPGFKNINFDDLERFFNELNIEFHVIKTDIAEIVFNIRKESNPCALCSKMRKGAINPYIKSIGCNKIALGHNKDDLIETMLMSLIYEGRINTFKPMSYLDRTDVTVIRPLLFIDEIDIKGFANAYPLPVIKSPCPADGNTKREYAKKLMLNLDKENKGAKKSLFNACLMYLDKKII
ncbi:MAG: tRNA 2-thiocytidine(32) synthetase TtcA [Lachnospiraceae bacterium]|nr:tRNA 2-thiocytidine(32) synthetase TtcA [Lachnospiraceae bacterium]